MSEGWGLACLRDTRRCWDFGRVGERGRRGRSLFDGGRGNEGAGERIRIGGWKEAIAMAVSVSVAWRDGFAATLNTSQEGKKRKYI